MICTNYIPSISTQCEPSINEKVLSQISQLPCGIRKELRLLSKQYEIIEIYQEPPIVYNKHITKENPLIIKYVGFEDFGKVFEWVIEPERIH